MFCIQIGYYYIDTIRNSESGYIDYSDNNKSDYYYDAIRCILFYYLKIVKNKYKNEKNEYIEEIKKLLDDIYIYLKSIFSLYLLMIIISEMMIKIY